MGTRGVRMHRKGDRWDALATAIDGRMLELGLSQAALAARSGVSDFTLKPLRDGAPKNYRDLTLVKVARGLGWTPDSVERVLTGGQPVIDTSNAADHPTAEVAGIELVLARLAAIEAEIAAVREQIVAYDRGDRSVTTPDT